MGVAGFGVENRRRPFFMGKHFMGKHISVICNFTVNVIRFLSSIPICEAVDTFQKGMEQK